MCVRSVRWSQVHVVVQISLYSLVALWRAPQVGQHLTLSVNHLLQTAALVTPHQKLACLQRLVTQHNNGRPSFTQLIKAFKGFVSHNAQFQNKIVSNKFERYVVVMGQCHVGYLTR